VSAYTTTGRVVELALRMHAHTNVQSCRTSAAAAAVAVSTKKTTSGSGYDLTEEFDKCGFVLTFPRSILLCCEKFEVSHTGLGDKYLQRNLDSKAGFNVEIALAMGVKFSAAAHLYILGLFPESLTSIVFVAHTAVTEVSNMQHPTSLSDRLKVDVPVTLPIKLEFFFKLSEYFCQTQ